MTINNMPGHLIRRYHQAAVAIFHREVRPSGYEITPVQYAAMERLAESPGIDQITLAGLIAYDRSTITGVIDRLVNKNWATRTTNTGDRRARVVYLTPEGQTVLDDVQPYVHHAQSIMLSGLSTEEAGNFLRLLAKATRGVNNLSRAPISQGRGPIPTD